MEQMYPDAKFKEQEFQPFKAVHSKLIRYVFPPIVAALKTIHNKQLIHRDISPLNLFLHYE